MKKHNKLTYTLSGMLALTLSQHAGAQELVTEVWVHDVPGPPQGDFWDSTFSSALGLFAGKAGIYPDVMVCLRPFSGGKQSCTPICVDLQGDTTLGGSGKSTACRRPVRVALPPGDPRMQIEVLEMDDVDSRPRVHAVIAQVGVTDPVTCPHEKPCQIEMPKGSLVLSFSAQSRVVATANVGTASQIATAAQDAAANDAAAMTQMDGTSPTGSGTQMAQGTPTRTDVATASAPQTSSSPPSPSVGCTPPSIRWRDLNKGLHGPFTSADDAVMNGGAGWIAWKKIRERTFYQQSEWGFVIVRDRRDATKYYVTPPVPSSIPWSADNPPKMQWTDYIGSLGKAFDGSCARIQDYIIAANAHVHPWPAMWGISNSIDNFSMNDFAQAVQLKNRYGFSANGPYDSVPIGSTNYVVKTQDLVPNLEKIYMINESDSAIYVFAPKIGDPEIKQADIVSDTVLVRANAQWQQYGLPDNKRVWIIAAFE